MRNRILSFTFFEAVGSFLITPILAIYLAHTLGMSEGAIAIAITTLYFSRYIIALPLGRLTDLFNPTRIMSLGALLRGSGYGILALIPEGTILLVAASLALIGIGGALISPASSRLLAQIDGDNSLKFRLNSMMFSIGSASALMMVSFIDKEHFLTVFYCSSIVFFIASIYALTLKSETPDQKEANDKKPQSSTKIVIRLARQHAMLLGILFSYTIAYAQLFYLLPIMIDKNSLSHSYISYIYIANSAFFVFFQPLWQRLSPVKDIFSTAILSALFFFLGYFLLDIGFTPISIVIFAVCYAFAGSILDALFLAELADQTKESEMGTASGMAFMFRGAGLISGNVVGALTLYFDGSHVQYLPVYLSIGLMAGLAATKLNIKRRSLSVFSRRSSS
ncbi:MFS transporter [Vibrio cholerae]|uniref:MFS transporter n=1 Tax=Vibrio cholerae TaxID=666 RepID=UPI0022722BED|nr:MFS transporter [Vibrio cholerae]MCX9439923.1 MFS transporter [Vibrio cholerae]